MILYKCKWEIGQIVVGLWIDNSSFYVGRKDGFCNDYSRKYRFYGNRHINNFYEQPIDIKYLNDVYSRNPKSGDII